MQYRMHTTNSKVTIVMYHYVRNLASSRYPNIKGLELHTFKKHLEFFASYYKVITMQDFLLALNGQKDLPKNALLLTFDDGLLDHYLHVFPLLKAYNFQGSFFINAKTLDECTTPPPQLSLLDVHKIHFILANRSNTDNLLKELYNMLDYARANGYSLPSNNELFFQYAKANRWDNKKIIFIKRILQNVLDKDLRQTIASQLFKKYVGVCENIFARELYMNADQLKLMQQEGMFIGVHGYDHFWMDCIDKKVFENDLNKALVILSDFIDKKNFVYCYPYGGYNNHLIDFLKSKRCATAFSTEPRIANLHTENPYLIPRIDCNDITLSLSTTPKIFNKKSKV
ncbi:polysaccharide deacetylase family protein [Helicobacter cetorum]|uniref:polysaccharide deacetylase family protein n=1 Tax=Helicobacter cetorum TaxID=138563 RepID=UPI001F40D128|nr:polysaccharide deacetylase family protein [Helicobacter cetorum]